jgi:hypothetical protein
MIICQLTYPWHPLCTILHAVSTLKVQETKALTYLRSKELLLRWAEVSALSDVVLRTHPGNLPDQSHQIYTDNSTLKCYRKLCQIHKIFVDYRQKVLMPNATRYGHPMVRSLWMHYPDDQVAQQIGGQFLYAAYSPPHLIPTCSHARTHHTHKSLFDFSSALTLFPLSLSSTL